MSMNGGGNDQQQNCILEVCCGGAADEPKIERALAKQIAKDAHDQGVELTDEQALASARSIRHRYDLAPKGTLYAFKQAIAKLARGPAYTD